MRVCEAESDVGELVVLFALVELFLDPAPPLDGVVNVFVQFFGRWLDARVEHFAECGDGFDDSGFISPLMHLVEAEFALYGGKQIYL